MLVSRSVALNISVIACLLSVVVALTGCASAGAETAVASRECNRAWALITGFTVDMQTAVDASTTSADPSSLHDFLDHSDEQLTAMTALAKDLDDRELATNLIVLAREYGDLVDAANVTLTGGATDAESTKIAINRTLTDVKSACGQYLDPDAD